MKQWHLVTIRLQHLNKAESDWDHYYYKVTDNPFALLKSLQKYQSKEEHIIINSMQITAKQAREWEEDIEEVEKD